MGLHAAKTPDLPLARILGWLSGDGHVEARSEKGKRSIHRELRFFPDDEHVAELFSANFRRRFGVRPHVYDTVRSLGCYTVGVRNTTVLKFIISLAAFGHFGWRVPNFKYSEEDVQWIKSFFDCEAYVSTTSRSIQVKSVNREGLAQVCRKLRELEIDAKLYGPYRQRRRHWSPYYVVQVKGRSAISEFRNRVGFNHPKKQAKLEAL